MDLTPEEKAIYDKMVAEVRANGMPDLQFLNKMAPADYLALRCQTCGGTRESVPHSTDRTRVKCGSCGEISHIQPN